MTLRQQLEQYFFTYPTSRQQDVVKSFERLKKENRRLTARVGALAEDEEAMLG